MHAAGLILSLALQLLLAWMLFWMSAILDARPSVAFYNLNIALACGSLMPIWAAVRRGPPTLLPPSLCLAVFPVAYLLLNTFMAVRILLDR